MVRIIPGDIVSAGDDRLQLSYFDNSAGKGIDAVFDLVVLSIGLLPFKDASRIADLFGLSVCHRAFLARRTIKSAPTPRDFPEPVQPLAR